MRGTPGLPEPEIVNPPTPAKRDVDDLVYIGLRDNVVALDRDSGEIVWQWKAPKGNSYCTVLVDGDCVLAGVYGYVYCLDAATGAQRWDNPMKGFGVGVTSIATRRGSTGDVDLQAAAAAIAAAAAAAS